MTVIAFDGHIIAADRQATDDGLISEVTKLHRLDNGDVVAFNGGFSHGLAMLEWYRAGCEGPLPALLGEENAFLCGVDKFGWFEIENTPHKQRFSGRPFHAAGSGRRLAIGAMAFGAGAVRAVEITCELDAHCGMGVDYYRVFPVSKPVNNSPLAVV